MHASLVAVRGAVATVERAGEVDAVPTETQRISVQAKQVALFDDPVAGLLEVRECPRPALRQASRDVLTVSGDQMPMELGPHLVLGGPGLKV